MGYLPKRLVARVTYTKLSSKRTKWAGGGVSDILVSTSTDVIAHSRKRPEDHFSLTPRDKMCP